jgi:hypothetical protein
VVRRTPIQVDHVDGNHDRMVAPRGSQPRRELAIDNAGVERPQHPQEEIDRVKKPKDEG